MSSGSFIGEEPDQSLEDEEEVSDQDLSDRQSHIMSKISELQSER